MATIVSIVPYSFLPARIGGQKVIAFFNQYFARHHRLICVSVQKNEEEKADGYSLLKLLSDARIRYVNPFYFFTVKNVIRQNGASHLMIDHPYYGWLAFLLKRTLPVKLIVRSHNIEALRFKTIGKWWWRILWHYEKFTHRLADYNFFINEEDKDYAIENYKLKPEKCLVATFGTEREKIPEPGEVLDAKKAVRQIHGINENEKILFFIGSFIYPPNREALRIIRERIQPLLNQKNLIYRLIVCGPGIEPEQSENLIITGYVEEVSLYFKAADVFINPVTGGGGIKTKLVEALAYNCNAVSTQNGAIGVPSSVCGSKLLLVTDNDWRAFVASILTQANNASSIPSAFYDHFNWNRITAQAAGFIEKIPV